jgi:pyroglutamyl-peptidase
MRILVYGFAPYRQFRSNITMEIVRRLPRRAGLNKIVFSVRFNRRQFIDALRRFQPDIVIGLGQCSRGRKLRIETRAINLRRNRKQERLKKIALAGAPKLKTNLRLAMFPDARRSRSAGDYVCNYSMYVILDFLRCNRASTRYGFIHIPHDYDPQRASRLLDRVIQRVLRGTR